ncbi:pilus assembly protein N-terminal domain-containing protein [Stieleria marina]|uniref:Pilus formation protein N-terminal domain-containing protein n=1 Tax=Stieleria marina TaxID=1930275 RepID=A0A517P140_9BACT|nr:hypothetical protein K239x_51100 [Planctomycetes bacterium K23_9]
MRDPMKMINRPKKWRMVRSHILTNGRRRALAASLMLLSTPLVMADDSQPGSKLTLPPLPLPAQHAGDSADHAGASPLLAGDPVQQVSNHEIYDNPFCEPELRPIRQENVTLASSQMQPAVRLKSAGAVIGLQPIGSGKPVQVRPRSVKIETPPVAGVQDNPLIQSQHHDNADLVDVSLPNGELEELVMAPRGESISAKPETSIRMTMAPVDSLPILQVTQPVAERVHRSILVQSPPPVHSPEPVLSLPAKPAPVAVVASQPIATPIEKAVVDSALITPPVVQEVASSETATPLKPAESVVMPISEAPTEEPESVPVFMSMSDSSGTPSPGTTAASKASTTETARIEQSIQSPSDQEAKGLANKTVKPVVISKLDSQANQGIVAVAEPIGLEPLNLAASDQRQKLEMSDDAVAIPSPVRGTSPIVGRPASANSTSVRALLSSHKRYRAPVAVDAPPVAITLAPSKGTIASTVSSRASVKMAQPVNVPGVRKQVKRKAPELTKLHLTKAQVRSLTIGGMVRRIDVTDKSVCQAIATGPNQLKLIGTGNGITRLVVWADTSGNSHTRARMFEIHVQDAVEATGGSVGTKTQTLNQSIYNAFPSANVSVQEYRDRLIVSGHCGSEEDAKKIIRMVRKTCLIPVRDEIKVR